MALQERAAVLFAGQGSYRSGFLTELVGRYEVARHVVAGIDEIASGLGAETLAERVVAGTAPDVDTLVTSEPDLLQLAIYGTSVAVHAVVRDRLPAPAAAMGHSMGEISALVAGGALSMAEGAEVVIHRSSALRELAAAPGAMLALSADPERAQRILDLIEDPLAAVAAENGPQQTVVSGPAGTVDTAAAIARSLGVSSVRLVSPYPFHSPVLAPAVAAFAGRIAHLGGRPLTIPVWSPTLGRFLRPDDTVADVLAQALVRRVRFSAAVAGLSRHGVTTFRECGGGDGLARLVRRLVPAATALAGISAAEGSAPATIDLRTPAVALVPALAPVAAAAPVAHVVHAAPTPAAPAAPVPTAPAPVASASPVAPVAPIAPVPTAAAPAAAPVAVPAPAATAADSTGSSTREEVFAGLRTLYATALEYPEEVFDEDVSLEADLGVDSVKQTELLGRAAEAYGMGERPENFRLGDYDTMGRLVDYVWSASANASGARVGAAA